MATTFAQVQLLEAQFISSQIHQHSPPSIPAESWNFPGTSCSDSCVAEREPSSSRKDMFHGQTRDEVGMVDSGLTSAYGSSGHSLKRKIVNPAAVPRPFRSLVLRQLLESAVIRTKRSPSGVEDAIVIQPKSGQDIENDIHVAALVDGNNRPPFWTQDSAYTSSSEDSTVSSRSVSTWTSEAHVRDAICCSGFAGPAVANGVLMRHHKDSHAPSCPANINNSTNKSSVGHLKGYDHLEVSVINSISFPPACRSLRKGQTLERCDESRCEKALSPSIISKQSTPSGSSLGQHFEGVEIPPKEIPCQVVNASNIFHRALCAVDQHQGPENLADITNTLGLGLNPIEPCCAKRPARPKSLAVKDKLGNLAFDLFWGRCPRKIRIKIYSELYGFPNTIDHWDKERSRTVHQRRASASKTPHTHGVLGMTPAEKREFLSSPSVNPIASGLLSPESPTYVHASKRPMSLATFRSYCVRNQIYRQKNIRLKLWESADCALGCGKYLDLLGTPGGAHATGHSKIIDWMDSDLHAFQKLECRLDTWQKVMLRLPSFVESIVIEAEVPAWFDKPTLRMYLDRIMMTVHYKSKAQVSTFFFTRRTPECMASKHPLKENARS